MARVGVTNMESYMRGVTVRARAWAERGSSRVLPGGDGRDEPTW